MNTAVARKRIAPAVAAASSGPAVSIQASTPSEILQVLSDRKRYLARHIVVATTVDARRGSSMPHDFQFVVDAHAGGTPLTGTTRHHQSYENNESEGAI